MDKNWIYLPLLIYLFFSLQFEHSHILIFAVITITGCNARSTKVSAQYSVSEVGNENNGDNVRTFNSRGIVEDASSDGILNAKLNNGKFRVSFLPFS